MADKSTTPRSTSHLSLAALALGTVGLLLFFMPILGLPLACLSGLLAVAGLIAALFRANAGRFDMRLATLAVLLAALALVVNVLILFAPQVTAYQRSPAVPMIPSPHSSIPPAAE